LLEVLNDPSQPPGRRIRAAIAAAPYVHPRVVPLVLSKKEAAAEAARTVGHGDWQGDL
jgi:ABC-type sulfate transport system permease subunit